MLCAIYAVEYVHDKAHTVIVCTLLSYNRQNVQRCKSIFQTCVLWILRIDIEKKYAKTTQAQLPNAIDVIFYFVKVH